MPMIDSGRRLGCITTAAIALFAGSLCQARSLTLQEALDIAVGNTGRGRIIEGNLEVAEQQYFAERVGFYVPEISINGRVPTYSVDESYGFYPGTRIKGFVKETNSPVDADITLKQNLITGGDLTLQAFLVDDFKQYPVAEIDNQSDVRNLLIRDIDEAQRRGTFNFSLQQPLLQPSEAKNTLHNARDDLDLARINQAAETATLKKEVVDAFFGCLRSDLTATINTAKLESARLQADIDSAKLGDGVVSEETWLESAAARLDAELQMFDADQAASQQRRELASLLEWSGSDSLVPEVPSQVVNLTDDEQRAYLTGWPECNDIRKARLEHQKAQRAAKYAASSHGLTGSLKATYGLERGRVEDNLLGPVKKEQLRTNNYGVSLNFSYPLWDGGASSAAIKAKQIEEEQARLTLQKTEKAARNEVENLVTQANLSYRKLSLLQRQIELVRNRRDIAQERFDNGEISRLTFLESEVSLLQAQDKYLEQMQQYYETRVTLEGFYLP